MPFKASYLVHGTPGHPLHPPLTDAVIGTYTVATALAFADVTGISDTTAAHGWWLALLFGLVVTVPTALTGLVDWLKLTRRTPLWWTATYHLIVMVSATVFFGIAALTGHDDWRAGNLGAAAFTLTLIGFCLLAFGGWLGGTIVFVHGMRVLGLADEPTGRAISPQPAPEEVAEEKV
jgi:uncharacterized membrane protein